MHCLYRKYRKCTAYIENAQHHIENVTAHIESALPILKMTAHIENATAHLSFLYQGLFRRKHSNTN